MSRVVPQFAAKRRKEVVEHLLEVVQAITSGDIDADACVVVLSLGDIHRPYWCGYFHEKILSHAKWSILDEDDPEEAADQRASYANSERERIETYRREHPWHCSCSADFKTQRGLRRHLTHWRKINVEGWAHDPVDESVGFRKRTPIQAVPDA